MAEPFAQLGDRMQGRFHYPALTAAYLALGVIFTWPLVLHLGTQTPIADASGDQFQTIWFFWWMKKALFALHQSPYWTNDIYFPYGTGLGYHLCPLTNLLAIGVSTLTGTAINSAFVFNALVLLSFVITGLGAYALIRQLTGSSTAALWGSIAIVVAPYRYWHLNHLNLLLFGWGLFAVYFALRLLHEPKVRYALASALFFAAMFYACLTGASFTVFLLIGCVAASAGAIWRHRQRRRVLLIGFLGAILALVLVAPGLMALSAVGSSWHLRWEETVKFSATLSDFYVPTTQTSMAARWLGLVSGFAPGMSSEIFLGWFLLAATAAVIITLRRAAPWRWLILAAVFLILSLGPTLKLGGQYRLDGLMPYRWLVGITPYLSLSRTPGRLAMLGHLFLVIFCAHGLAIALQRHSRVREPLRRPLVMGAATFALVAILFVEYSPGNTQLWDMTVPEVYQEVASDPAIHVIYDGPIATSSQICNRYMYWQTFHGKKSVNGYLTHRSRDAWTLFDRMSKWRQFGESERAELVEVGIDAIVWHDPDGAARLMRLR